MVRPPLRCARVRGADLAYVEQGQGPSVVFVHGAMGDHRVWEAQREPVAERFRFIALDQRHFGRAAWPEGDPSYSLATHADDLADFIRQRDGGQPVHVVGWSYGGAVALALAVRHRALLRSLFLCEPALMSIASDAADVARLRDERRRLGPAMAAAAAGDALEAARRFADWIEDDADAFGRMPAAQRQIFEDNARTVPLHFASGAGEPIGCADLAALGLPAEVTVGGLTRPFFRILAETTQRCLPGSRLTVIDGTRHLAPLDQPEAFNRALLRFLAER